MPVSLQFEFTELDPSREISFSQSSVSQKFQFLIKGNFRAWAADNGYIDGTYGPDDDIGMLKAVWQIIPDFRLLPLKNNSDVMLFGNVLELKIVVADVWKVDVEYTTPSGDGRGPGDTNQLDPNDDYETWSQRYVQVSLTASTDEENKTLSRKLVGYHWNNILTGTPIYELNKPAPMGLTEDGVEGVGVYCRQLDFSLTTYLTPQEASLAYGRLLYRLAGTVNNGVFFGFPAKSVLFLTGNVNMDNPYSLVPVELQFKMRPNFKLSQTGPSALMNPADDNPANMFDVIYDPYFPSTPSGVVHSGWCKLEYLYAKSVQSGSIMSSQTPTVRLIHENYEYTNFNLLAVGGGPPV